MCVAPGATMAEVLQQHCGASATIDADANYVFTSASVSLVQQLGMGTQASPLQIKVPPPRSLGLSLPQSCDSALCGFVVARPHRTIRISLWGGVFICEFLVCIQTKNLVLRSARPGPGSTP